MWRVEFSFWLRTIKDKNELPLEMIHERSIGSFKAAADIFHELFLSSLSIILMFLRANVAKAWAKSEMVIQNLPSYFMCS